MLYRRYREGELPDIQIKYADVIRSFQALAQVSLLALISYSEIIWYVCSFVVVFVEGQLVVKVTLRLLTHCHIIRNGASVDGE